MQKKLVLVSPTSQRLVELFGLESKANEMYSALEQKIKTPSLSIPMATYDEARSFYTPLQQLFGDFDKYFWKWERGSPQTAPYERWLLQLHIGGGLVTGLTNSWAVAYHPVTKETLMAAIDDKETSYQELGFKAMNLANNRKYEDALEALEHARESYPYPKPAVGNILDVAYTTFRRVFAKRV